MKYVSSLEAFCYDNVMNFIRIFDFFKGEELNPIQCILKIIGTISFTIAVFGAGLISLNGGTITRTIWNDIGSYSLVAGGTIGTICFLGVGMYSAGKSRGLTTISGSAKHVFKMIFLTMFLPAIVICSILTAIFILPRL